VTDRFADIIQGRKYSVAFTKSASKDFGKLKKDRGQDSSRLKGLIRKFCDYGGPFQDHQFKREESFKLDGRTVVVYQFRSNQVRVYGGYIDNCKIFACTKVHIKKTNKADMKMLENVAKTLVQLDRGNNHG